MNALKKIVSSATGFWLHKISSLPIGADLQVDIHRRMGAASFTTIFDVGANIGQSSQWFRSIEPRATIYCFEPVASTFALLRKATEKDNNIIIEHMAFGAAAGTKTIRLFDQFPVLNSLKDDLMNDNENAREEIISVETIDRYCLQKNIGRIDLLKIDTEGYELPVLEGSNQMLQEGRISFIYCEVGFSRRNTRNTYLPELGEWLEIKGFHFFGLYQVASNGGVDRFGNALFVHDSVYDG